MILKSFTNATFYFSDKSTSLIQANLQINELQTSSQTFILQLDWTTWLQNVELNLIPTYPHFLILSDTLYEDFLLDDVLSLIRFLKIKWKGVRVVATYQERGGRERILMRMERWGMEGRKIVEKRKGKKKEKEKKEKNTEQEKKEEEMKEKEEEEEVVKKDEICIFEIRLKR